MDEWTGLEHNMEHITCRKILTRKITLVPNTTDAEQEKANSLNSPPPHKRIFITIKCRSTLLEKYCNTRALNPPREDVFLTCMFYARRSLSNRFGRVFFSKTRKIKLPDWVNISLYLYNFN